MDQRFFSQRLENRCLHHDDSRLSDEAVLQRVNGLASEIDAEVGDDTLGYR
jgi:hypothetical protein